MVLIIGPFIDLLNVVNQVGIYDELMNSRILVHVRLAYVVAVDFFLDIQKQTPKVGAHFFGQPSWEQT